MITNLLNIAFSGFWQFLGVMILFLIPTLIIQGILNLIAHTWTELMTHLSIRKHGWPKIYSESEQTQSNEKK